jgi:hypothetical protein
VCVDPIASCALWRGSHRLVCPLAWIPSPRVRGSHRRYAPPDMRKEVSRLRRTLGARGYGAFVSHCKREAQTEARNLKEMIEKELHCRAFLDSDDLKDLGELRGHVVESDVLVLVQTRTVLERPWCVVELLTALEHNVPIVAVVPLSIAHSYDFADAKAFLEDFENELERRSPGAYAEIVRNWTGATPLGEMLGRLRSELPKLISVRVDYSMSSRVLKAMLDDVVETVEGASRRRHREMMHAHSFESLYAHG